MRLFYALTFSKQSLSKLAGVQQNLLSTLDAGRPTRTELLHLTLLFLGEVEAERIPFLTASLNALSYTMDSLTVPALRFIQRSRRSMVWATVAEQEELKMLKETLRSSLLSNDFHTPKERFEGHITLIRNAEGAIDTSIKPFTLSVSSLTLFHSHTQRGVLTHTPLCSNPL